MSWSVCCLRFYGKRTLLFEYDNLSAAEKMYNSMTAEYPAAYVDIMERREDGGCRWVKRSDGVSCDTTILYPHKVTA